MLSLLVFFTITGWAAADFDPVLHEKYLTMPKSAFVEHFNKQNYSWKIKDNHRLLKEYPPCELDPIASIDEIPIINHDHALTRRLPTSFDARDKWTQCDSIRDVYNQGPCGSCWTFGSASTASDRTCIHKKTHVRLSEQDFECLQTRVCGGGNSYDAFVFWKDYGLVTQDCKPYNITGLLEQKCKYTCVRDNINYKQDKHFAADIYRVPNQSEQIKAELVNNGPIQASFPVYADFYDYESGVYIHTYGGLHGYHSVRVIGYGVENGMEYWLVANSWGDWGEHGLFKIKTFQKDVAFEDRMTTGMPKM